MTSKPSKVFDIKVRAYRLALDLIMFVDKLPRRISNDVLVKQVLRSATSIGANIVESKAASSEKDFVNFRLHSLKSANETLYWLCLLRDTNGPESVKITALIAETQEIAKILAVIIKKVRSKN
jgi:four helix bundle protein